MIFGKVEYRFIWIALGSPIKLTHVKVHEQHVPKYDGKRWKDLALIWVGFLGVRFVVGGGGVKLLRPPRPV